jgi:hypothetical protein
MEKQIIDILQQAKKLFEDNNPNIDISKETQCGFGFACRNGYLEVAKFISQVNPAIVISATIDNSFYDACNNGHLEVVKWLHEIKPNIKKSLYDIEKYRENGHGHDEVVKWLLQFKPDFYNSESIECVFSGACARGQLDFAKWLLNFKPTIDICSQDDYAFRSACKNNNIEVVKWLQSFYPKKYYVEIVDNKISSYKMNLIGNKQIIELIHKIVLPYFKFEMEDFYGDRCGAPYPKIEELNILLFKRKNSLPKNDERIMIEKIKNLEIGMVEIVNYSYIGRCIHVDTSVKNEDEETISWKYT